MGPRLKSKHYKSFSTPISYQRGAGPSPVESCILAWVAGQRQWWWWSMITDHDVISSLFRTHLVRDKTALGCRTKGIHQWYVSIQKYRIWDIALVFIECPNQNCQVYVYLFDLKRWNVVDFITNSLYVATIGLRTVAYVEVLHHVIKRGDQLKIQIWRWQGSKGWKWTLEVYPGAKNAVNQKSPV